MILPKGIVLLVSCTILPLQAQGSHWKAHDGWGLRDDKLLHIGAGAIVAGAVYPIAKSFGASPKWAAIIAQLAAFTAGIAKERYDSHHGGWKDPADATYTGAVGGSFAWVAYRSDPDRKKEFATAPRLEH